MRIIIQYVEGTELIKCGKVDFFLFQWDPAKKKKKFVI